MGIERTIAKAETVVLNEESKYLNDLIKSYEDVMPFDDSGELKDPLLEKIQGECCRLNPKDKYDHEEVFLATGKYTIGNLLDKEKPRI